LLRKNDFLQRIRDVLFSQGIDIPNKELAIILATMSTVASDALRHGEEVQVGGLGIFSIRIIEPRSYSFGFSGNRRSKEFDRRSRLKFTPAPALQEACANAIKWILNGQ